MNSITLFVQTRFHFERKWAFQISSCAISLLGNSLLKASIKLLHSLLRIEPQKQYLKLLSLDIFSLAYNQYNVLIS